MAVSNEEDFEQSIYLYKNALELMALPDSEHVTELDYPGALWELKFELSQGVRLIDHPGGELTEAAIQAIHKVSESLAEVPEREIEGSVRGAGARWRATRERARDALRALNVR